MAPGMPHIPLREKVSALFKLSHCFPRRSSRRSETITRPRAKTRGSGGAQSDTWESASRKYTAKDYSSVRILEDQRRKPAGATTNFRVKSPQVRRSPSRSRNSSPARINMSPARINMSPANIRVQSPQVWHNPSRSRNSSPARINMSPSRTNMSPARINMSPARTNMSPARNTMSPGRISLSGELPKSGSVARSSSKNLSKLRDQYVRLMLKMADMSSQTVAGSGAGAQIDRDSQVFESEVLRRTSQADGDLVDYYLQNSIQPDEWKHAHMGSRILRHSTL